ncbi:MAG: hypothetical protein EOP43_01855 [Sphingobacteriaceae bacterium]|nr:MAG: hypothetical protein EOP43_01855 [Sphingobacteriaceae bacterium]
MGKDQQGAFPNHGFCAAQNAKYYNYKLHAVCSVDGIFENFDLAPPSAHDVHYLKNIQQQMSDCVILGDKGYLSQQLQLNLFETVNIKLETPTRSNQTDFKTYPYIFNKSRKGLKHSFPNYAINSRSGKITPRRSWNLKQEY